MPRLYVKRGKRRDTYWTILAGKYHGLGNDRQQAETRLRDLTEGRPTSGTVADSHRIASAKVAHFWSKVRAAGAEKCWPWSGYVGLDGYGQACVNYRRARAHRLAFELAIGQIPAGFVVRHSCDNRLCCNPAHLSIGTHADNVADRVLRGRSATKSKGTWRGGFAKKQKAAPQYRPASHHVDTPIELCFESHIREKLRSLE